ncbi:TrfA family protein [Comamonadaceae bacterium OH2310_COT-174]|nr:TrfA family protein [Comamonadaceae bacterium OH2310_COT-174]
MKKAGEGSKQIEQMQRTAYLRSKGLGSGVQFQLDLIFPETIGERDDLRHIPNDYARSSIFTARNKRVPRRTLMHEKLFHYNEHVSILYTGIELRAEDDEVVWLQILNYGKAVALGEPFEFSIKDLVADVGWHKNGRYYDKARECISRLKANEVLAINTKAYGKSGAVSLIQNYTAINDEQGKPTHYRVWVDPNLIVLFAGNTFTSHVWDAYRSLSPVARRLADYIESHRNPFPLALGKFKEMCGSTDASPPSWRQTVKKACAEVQAAQIVKVAFLSKDDQIRFASE